MALTFVPLHLDHSRRYGALLSRCSDPAADYSFVNLWAWHGKRRFEVAFDDNLAWIQCWTPDGPVLWAPVGAWKGVPWEAVLRRHFPGGVLFERVPEPMARHWEALLGDGVSLEEQRDEGEYLYAVDDLVHLAGNRFHKKKNLLKQFLSAYAFRYQPLDTTMLDSVRRAQEDWCAVSRCAENPGLDAESDAVSRVLEAWSKFPGLRGGVLLVEERVVAYTIAEALTEDTLVIHFEKGLPAFKGVYQAINQMFLAAEGDAFLWVNREQDLGDEGLRRAKLSYNPVRILAKYLVHWKG